VAAPDLADGIVATQSLPAGSMVDLVDWTVAVEVAGLPGSGAGTTPAVAGYTAWYDASAIAGVGDGAKLAAWSDGSANHYHLAQATAANQPTFYSSGPANLINGLPVVAFDGAHTVLVSTSAAVPAAHPLCCFAVVRNASLVSYGTVFDHTNYYRAGGTGGQWTTRDLATTVQGGVEDTAAHVVTSYLPGTGTGVIRMDGAVVASSAMAVSTPGPGSIWVGEDDAGFQWWTGAIAEIVYYAGVTLTVAQLAANEAYLKAKWGTP
jgi:hypothetical protein